MPTNSLGEGQDAWGQTVRAKTAQRFDKLTNYGCNPPETPRKEKSVTIDVNLYRIN
jgi:hypothetical protein